jgi:hypothetical protein
MVTLNQAMEGLGFFPLEKQIVIIVSGILLALTNLHSNYEITK